MATHHELGPEGQSPGSEERAGEVWEKAHTVGERVRGGMSQMVQSGKSRVADQLDRLGQRVEDRVRPWEEQGGFKGRIGRMGHRAGDALEQGADYLRTHEIGEIRDDVRSQIVAHPFLSCGIALGAGFVLGRAFSHGDEERYERAGRRERPGVLRRAGRMAMAGAGAMIARGLRNRAMGR